MLGLVLLGGRLRLCAWCNGHSVQQPAARVHNITFEQDRVCLALELEMSGFAGLRLSGMGESSPLVTEVESPKSIKMTHAATKLTTTPTKCRQAPTALTIR